MSAISRAARATGQVPREVHRIMEQPQDFHKIPLPVDLKKDQVTPFSPLPGDVKREETRQDFAARLRAGGIRFCSQRFQCRNDRVRVDASLNLSELLSRPLDDAVKIALDRGRETHRPIRHERLPRSAA